MKKSKKRKVLKENKEIKHFEEFLKGMEQISDASRKILEVGRNISDVADVLHAEERIDDLPIKAFGDGGSHIVIRGQEHIGKKTKVIIKK